MDCTQQFYDVKKRQWADEKELGVWVTLALYGAFAVRVWMLPPPGPLAGILGYCAACLALIAWRRSRWRASYHRHQELAAALLRVLGTGFGSFLTATGRMLATLPSLRGAPLPAYAALLTFASGGPTCLHFAVAFKMRFVMNVSTQLAFVAVVRRFHAPFCALPALSDAHARSAISRLYGGLSYIAYLLPFPASSLVEPDAQAECVTVLSWLHLSLGFLLPLAWEARAEALLFLKHQRLRERAGLPPERGLHASMFRALGWVWAEESGMSFPAVLAVLLALAWDWIAFFNAAHLPQSG